MSREKAIAHAFATFDDGQFANDLARRVAMPTESQVPDNDTPLRAYLLTEMRPALETMGFTTRLLEHTNAPGPFLYAERMEGEGLPTVLGYGHGDVVRGMADAWRDGLDPWKLQVVGEDWYGRGVVDNKGQHSVNLAAQAAVIATRGKLGFNAKWIIEMGEETGSPGLREICENNRDLLKADLLIASDGPRLRPIARRFFSAHAAAFRSTSKSMRARVGIIPATGADCYPIRASSSRMPSPASWARRARSACHRWCRRGASLRMCVRRLPIACPSPARTIR